MGERVAKAAGISDARAPLPGPLPVQAYASPAQAGLIAAAAPGFFVGVQLGAVNKGAHLQVARLQAIRGQGVAQLQR